MINDFEKFISPLSSNQFFNDSFNSNEYFYLEKNEHRRVIVENLFSWELLNQLLNLNLIDYPRFRIAKAGKVINKELYIKYFPNGDSQFIEYNVEFISNSILNGCTIIIDAANLLSPVLYEFTKNISVELSVDLQVNVYASWGNEHGFDLHWDDHDVFILQLQGRKKWNLYGTTVDSPNRRMKKEMQKPEKILKEIILNQGDLLFVPRGHWHDVIPVGEPSLHLTIGAKNRTGIDFLSWLTIKNNIFSAIRKDINENDTKLLDNFNNLKTSFNNYSFDTLQEFLSSNKSNAYNIAVLSIPILNQIFNNTLFEKPFQVKLNASRKIEPNIEGKIITFNHGGSKHSFPIIYENIINKILSEKNINSDILISSNIELKLLVEFITYLAINNIVQISSL